MNQMFEPNQSQLPLAEYLRPKSVSEIAGQKHILGEGKSLRVAIESGNLPSMILWGPPGVGKTTIARVIANSIDAEFISVSAVLSGVKDIREAIDKAQLNLQQYNKKTILFVDEVHRFNKSQQDAFLPHVESGLITFIGATTENPSFEVNSALLSRSQVYVLKMLDAEQVKLGVSLRRMNSPGSPVYRTWENVWPTRSKSLWAQRAAMWCSSALSAPPP